MAESEQNEKSSSTTLGEEGEETEEVSADEGEIEEESVEVIEEEEEEVVDDGGEEEEEEESEKEVKPPKKRRCKRKKKKPCYVCENEGEEEDEEEEEEEKEVVEEVEEKKEVDSDDDEEKKVAAAVEKKKVEVGGEEEGEEEEEEEEEESDIISTGFSVLSAVSFVWENEIYEFEELCDPGNIETIFQEDISEPQKLDEYGIYRYLQLCTTMKTAPMISLIRFLKTTEIDLSYRNVMSNNIKAMCAALEINNTVKKLSLKYSKLKVEDCLYIGHIMQSNPRISHLDFTGCRIGPQGLQLIIPHFLLYDTVAYLNLSKCDIEDEGMKALAYILMSSSTIQEVDLSYNKLGEESAGALGWVFKTNDSIRNLNLRYNNLTDPTSMRAFFRYLSTSFSISHLDLSWNGLNGVEMGIIIGNFLRRSESIECLDLSDNRFQGEAVIEIQLGLARSGTLRIFKMGRNPMSAVDADNLILGAKYCRTLKVLNLEGLWVNSSAAKELNKFQQEKGVEVVIEGVFSNCTPSTVTGPDYPRLILLRAQFEAQQPVDVKKKKDFGHFIWSLGEEPLTKDEFMLLVKKFKAKINKELFPELIKQFKIPKSRLINVVAMKEKYLSIFPDSKPPPPPRLKSKKVVKPSYQQEFGQLENLNVEEESSLMILGTEESEEFEEFEESEEFEEFEEDSENFDGEESVEVEEIEEVNE